MPISNHFEHKLIKKAVKYYGYNEPFNNKTYEDDFESSYKFYTKPNKESLLYLDMVGFLKSSVITTLSQWG